jgi:glycosyltransferase involved in cell wall biosynthesis
MKLLLYAHDWAPTFGGIQRITQNLARGLAGRHDPRIEVTLVTMTPAGGMNDAMLNYRVVRRPSFFSLSQLIRRADVVHVAGPCIAPLALGVLLRKPVVVEHHGFQAVCPNGQLLYQLDCSPCPSHFMAGRHLECLRCNRSKGWLASLRLWLLTFLRRGLSKHVSCNVVPTNYLDRFLEPTLPRTREIAHGLPPPQPLLASTPSSEHAHLFLFVGRLVSAKDPEILLRAATRLRKMGLIFRANFVGDGPERSRLEDRAKAADLASFVTFSGAISERQLEQAWVNADALVAPSLAGEVFGLVVAEAMLRGKPVIVPAFGALNEVAGDAAFTFPVGDDAALADCMREVIARPSEAASRGAIGRRRAERLFGQQTMVDEHARLYAEVVAPAK